MIQLVFDAGDTLGWFGPPHTVDLLAPLSRLPEDVVKRRVQEESRRFLHCAPELTEDVIAGLCGALLIDPADLPDPWPCGRFTAYPYARDVLRELCEITRVPAVVLSNVPVTSGPGRMRDLREQLDPYIQVTYTSYTLGLRKPDGRLWRWIADNHDVAVGEIVHVGDQWASDIHGALHAGCRAIHIGTRRPTPPEDECVVGRDRLGAAEDLRGVIDIVRDWHKDR